MKLGPSLLGLALLLGAVAITQAFVAQKNTEAGPAMTESAQKFLETLTAEQKEVALLTYDSANRFDWHFMPKTELKCRQLRDMTPPQRKVARALLASCLSHVVYEKATTIMDLEKILQKLEGEQARFKRDYLRYYFTLFGQPGPGKWGLSIEGHHLSLNFVVADGQVVAHTPAFFGANPAVVQASYGVGPDKGTRVLAQEELLGFELLASLSSDQRKTAVLADTAPADIRGPADVQPPQDKPEGLAAADLTSPQQETLQKLINTYARNMPSATADKELKKIADAGLDKVYFAWAGADKPGVGHYYRVQGPTFLIEFVNVQPDAAGNPANHIHSVWRDMAGDFAVPINK